MTTEFDRNSPLQPAPAFTVLGSPGLYDWLRQSQIGLAFTTYQTNRLFLVGSTSEKLTVNERLFDKPMGLYASGDRLYMSTRYQLWQFENRLLPQERYHSSDRLYFPSQAYTTGDLNVHDVVLDGQQQLLFVNTDFSCLATLQAGYSFVPIWQPSFISKLAAEDRCHLNGLAMVEGKATYVTACSATDTAGGWRDHRVEGGIIMHVPSNEIIATGLSMPHSPRWYQGKLWLLNSGTGELGYLDVGQAANKFVPIAFCPGFVRGLAFWNNVALVGLSKLRSRSFTGLPLEERLAAQGQEAQCGLMLIDLNTGKTLHWLHLDGVVQELFDVVVLPGVVHPRAIGLQNEDIERLINFPGSNGIIITKPTAKRPSQGRGAPRAGLPLSPSAAVQSQELDLANIKYQQVYHLNADNLAPYEAFTFPSLQTRWQTQPQRGELLGISAAVAGEMVGLAIAELLPDQTADMLSLYVLPICRRHGIGTRLVKHLEQSLTERDYLLRRHIAER
ncbi:TIGR03032 family protein [Nostoc sp.]|uniref:TIGR03032 family protein n=1 Tax=Nostoc sp. TaxID=1180 RepID=UPI002FFA2CAE